VAAVSGPANFFLVMSLSRGAPTYHPFSMSFSWQITAFRELFFFLRDANGFLVCEHPGMTEENKKLWALHSHKHSNISELIEMFY
jgi:hypothetical protein